MSASQEGQPNHQPRGKPGQQPSPGGDAGRWQCADAADLAAYPPKDARCTEVRHMLRDYADGDLGSEVQVAVDRHLQGCRDCSLALARAEHETLRLRDALRPRHRPDGSSRHDAPEGFTDRLMARLLTEEGLTDSALTGDGRDSAGIGTRALRLPRPDGEPEPGGDSPQPTTRNVLGRVLSGRGWRNAMGERRVRTAAFGVLAAAAAVLAVWALLPGETLPSAWRAEMVAQRGVVGGWSRDGATLPDGVAVAPGDVFQLPANGEATLHLDAAAGYGPGGARVDSTVAAAGPAALGLTGEGLVLWHGDLELQQRVGTAIGLELPGGSRAELGPGAARVAVRRVVTAADAVSAGPSFRGTLEVPAERGSLARFVPPAEVGPPLQIPPGFAVDFGTGMRATLRRVLDGAALAQVLSPGATADAAQVAATDAAATGRVVDAAGLGVSGAAVMVTFGAETDRVVTDEDGWFRSALHRRLADAASDGTARPVALLEVVPPAGRLEPRLPEPVEVAFRAAVAGDRATLLGRVDLQRSREVRGVLTAAAGQLDPATCEVRVAVHDEALGRLTPLQPEVVWDAAGGFAVQGLPTALGPRQNLVLLVATAGHAPLAAPLGPGVGLDPTPMWLELRLEPRAVVEAPLPAELAGRADAAELLVAVHGVPGLPAGLCAELIPGGVATAPEWLWLPGEDRWWRASPAGGDPSGDKPVTYQACTAPLPALELATLDLTAGAGRHLAFAAGHRYGRIGTGGAPLNLEVLAPGGGAVALDAELFALGARGPATWLGRVADLREGPVMPPALVADNGPASLVALGRMGATGRRPVTLDPDSGAPVTSDAFLQLDPCGWIDGGALATRTGFALLRLEPVGGAGAPLLRCARAEDGWRIRDVPAGSWRVVGWDGVALGNAAVVPGLGAVLVR